MGVQNRILAVVLSCCLLECGVLARDNNEEDTGKLYILAHPSSLVDFKTTTHQLPTSQIDDLFSAMLGFSIAKDLSWDGAILKSVWSRPKAVALVKIETETPIDINVDGANIPTYDTVMNSPANVDQLVTRIIAQYSNEDPVIVNLTPDNKILNVWAHRDGVFDDLPVTISDAETALLDSVDSLWHQYKTSHLDINNMADLVFFSELNLLEEIIKRISVHPTLATDNIPDVYSITLSGIRLLQSVYGPNSHQLEDAVHILNTVLTKVSRQLSDLYKNNMIVAVETEPTRSDKSMKQRNRRDILATDDVNMNLASAYDPDFPVFFHIILWTMVVLALTLYFVAVGMWNMDPGKDSIIYRMTNQRIKSE